MDPRKASRAVTALLKLAKDGSGSVPAEYIMVASVVFIATVTSFRHLGQLVNGMVLAVVTAIAGL